MTRYGLDEATVTIVDDTDKLMHYLYNLEEISNN